MQINLAATAADIQSIATRSPEIAADSATGVRICLREQKPPVLVKTPVFLCDKLRNNRALSS